MRRATWIVTAASTAPNGPSDACFYCRQKIGVEHNPDCVLRKRTVVVRLSVEYVTTVQDLDGPPPESALFMWNDGTYCLDNALEEILGLVAPPDDADDDKPACVCDFGKMEYVREATVEDERAWGFEVANVERV